LGEACLVFAQPVPERARVPQRSEPHGSPVLHLRERHSLAQCWLPRQIVAGHASADIGPPGVPPEIEAWQGARSAHRESALYRQVSITEPAAEDQPEIQLRLGREPVVAAQVSEDACVPDGGRAQDEATRRKEPS
jgi:hypothetical protein